MTTKHSSIPSRTRERPASANRLLPEVVGASAEIPVSRHNYRITTGFLQNEQDGPSQILAAFLNGTPLPVDPWNLGAIGYKPFAVFLEDRRELVVRKEPSDC